MMRTTLFASTAVVALALTLTGCGGSDNQPESADSPAQEQLNAPANTAAASTPLSQEEWVELCASGGTDPENERCFEDMEEEDSGDEMGIPADEIVKIGDEFRINSFDADSTIYHWDVKITGFETVDVLKNAADNPDYYSGDDLDAPEKIDAEPEDGNEFVHITYEQKNVAGVPASLTLEASLVFADGEVFAPLDDDLSYYTPNLTEQHERPAGEEQNNNTVSDGDWVVEVPKNSDVQSIIITEYSIDADEEYWVDVK